MSITTHSAWPAFLYGKYAFLLSPLSGRPACSGHVGQGQGQGGAVGDRPPGLPFEPVGDRPVGQDRVAPLVERDELGQEFRAQPVPVAVDGVDPQLLAHVKSSPRRPRPLPRGWAGTAGHWCRCRSRARGGRSRPRTPAARCGRTGRSRPGDGRRHARAPGPTSGRGRRAPAGRATGPPVPPARPLCAAGRSGTARTGRPTPAPDNGPPGRSRRGRTV